MGAEFFSLLRRTIGIALEVYQLLHEGLVDSTVATCHCCRAYDV